MVRGDAPSAGGCSVRRWVQIPASVLPNWGAPSVLVCASRALLDSVGEEGGFIHPQEVWFHGGWSGSRNPNHGAPM